MTETQLQELYDKQAIIELCGRYCNLIWRKAGAAVADCYTEDGVFDSGARVARGREEIARTFAEVAKRPNGPYPYIHNIVIDLHGDTATGSCQSDVRYVEEGRVKLNGGYYDDTLARTPQGWKFKARVFRHTFEGWVATERGH